MLIRKVKQEDKNTIFNMMKVFYASDAVITNGSDLIFNNDIDTCISDSPYLEGFTFIKDEKSISVMLDDDIDAFFRDGLR